MAIFTQFLMSLTLLVLVACQGGGRGKSPSPAYNDQNGYIQGSYKILSNTAFINKVSNQLHLKTEMDGAPIGLGMILFQRDSELYSCTGFLVSDDIVATNSHCISDELKNNPSLDCSNYMAGVFYVNDLGTQERASCSKVLSFSDLNSEDDIQPDYAFFKLNKKLSIKKSFQISREGFSDVEKLHLHTIKLTVFIDDTGHGAYERKTCVAYKNNMWGDFTDRRSTEIKLVNSSDLSDKRCDVIHGNSGSPVTTTTNLNIVKGVVFGLTEIEDLKNLLDFITFNSDVQNYGTMTSFACVTLPSELNIPVDKSCAQFVQNESVLSNLKSELYYRENYQDFYQSIPSYLFSEIPRIFKTLMTFNEEMTMNVELLCVDLTIPHDGRQVSFLRHVDNLEVSMNVDAGLMVDDLRLNKVIHGKVKRVDFDLQTLKGTIQNVSSTEKAQEFTLPVCPRLDL